MEGACNGEGNEEGQESLGRARGGAGGLEGLSRKSRHRPVPAVLLTRLWGPFRLECSVQYMAKQSPILG